MAADETPGTGLAVFDPQTSEYPVLFGGDEGGIKEVLEENFGDEGFQASDLDRIKIPAAGGKFWEIPDETPVPEIEGVVVHKQKTRGYWIKDMDEKEEGDSGAPDCASADGILGNGLFGPGSAGNPSGACDNCPMNAFGSGKGNSKACKEQQQVFLLRSGAVLPIQFQLPATSLKDWRKYMTRLASKGKAFRSVVTKFTLRQEKSATNILYSIAVPSFVRDLDPAESAAAKEYGSTIKGAFDAMQEAREAAREAAERGEGEYEEAVATPGRDGIVDVNSSEA